MAISYFEDKYSFQDYMFERNQKESKEKGNKSAQGQGGDVKASSMLEKDSGEENSDEDDDEEEEEEAAINWNRGEAELMYTETRSTLHAIYDQEQKMDQD